MFDGVENAEYEITLTEYGFYRLEYYYSDSYGNSNVYILAFQVENGIPPKIKVEWSIRTVSAGKTITLPKATAVDDKEGAVETVCVVAAPNGIITVVSANGWKYKFAEKGTYRVRYFAVDSIGNLSEAVYHVTVKGGEK